LERNGRALTEVSDSFKAAKWDFEKQYILKKLKEFDGNISKTPEAIGLERSNLHKKIRGYGWT
jgi:two-component system nitrogen regulation response regulator NtrX